MSRYLLLFLSIVLFAFRTVSANLDTSDKTKLDSDVPQSQSQVSETNANPFRRVLSRLPGIRLGQIAPNGNREEIETLRQVIQASPDIDWQQFTAAPVLQPNCYVEVQVTQRMPGKCTKLGGRIPACQAQDLVTIDYDSCQ